MVRPEASALRSAPVSPMFSSSNLQNARENTMTTITKAAFVADLAETHNLNRQTAQEAVNAEVATLTQTLIDGHGFKLPGLSISPSWNRLDTPDAIWPPGKAWRSRQNATSSSMRPATSSDISGSLNDATCLFCKGKLWSIHITNIINFCQ